MPSFLDSRTSTFFPWPQGPFTIPNDMNVHTPFYMVQGNAYYFMDTPTILRLPFPQNPGVTMSVVLMNGGEVRLEEWNGELVEEVDFIANALRTWTYVNRFVRWKQIKV
jgi:hypothetical protein